MSESQLDRVKELSAILAEKATTAVVKQCVDLDEYGNVDEGCEREIAGAELGDLQLNLWQPIQDY